MILIRNIIVLLLCFSYNLSTLAATSNDTLQVTPIETGYLLNVPVSRIQLTIPDAKLIDLTSKMRKSANDRRYFYFADETRGLTVSGWFEQAGSFPGLNKFWQGEMASWKKNSLPAPLNVAAVQLNDWQAIFYDIDAGPESSKHVKAEIVLEGTWIDLHISISNSASPPPTREMLEDFLKGIIVTTKPAG
ncbi:hypothetical protein [Undibacterium sp. Ji22W]|uniref:hypothetical protein n=1 Tax=Undibacterium sp. Ji22W TaxID=3413038 RepID=UPI003BF1C1D0